MRKPPPLFSALLLLALFAAALPLAGQGHAAADYARRMQAAPLAAPARALALNTRAEAVLPLQFLYAYMPLPDVTDYPPEFYVRQVEVSLRARREMPWGSSVPDREWYHFVLPLRVNNERLDTFRTACYATLKARVQGLSMEQAVIAVNRWCHEHATYRPSDARTRSPLATMSAAVGRCGEESTFTVAALRAVGIPARQVYTPRWAHTDDNHAWVEAWVEGRWRFLGACEPEPVLDLGWFNAPASRGLLMHTKAFGRYDGPEDRLRTTNCFTEINVTDNYARTARTTVCVVDAERRPVADAQVRFCIYNYAELYPAHWVRTDAHGRASLSAGLGDLVVWAAKDDAYGWRKVSMGRDTLVVLALDRRSGERWSADLDLTPPAGHDNQPSLAPEAIAHNEACKAREDSLRHRYVAAFPDSAAILAFCRAEGFDFAAVRPLVEKSRGNSQSILRLLREFNDRDVVGLLAVLSEKDLTDLDPDALADHLRALPRGVRLDPDSARYVYSPRIAHEAISPWRSALSKAAPTAERSAFRENPLRLAAWLKGRLQLADAWNPLVLPHRPESAWACATTDSHGRDLLFVAMARALGIPARIDPVTGRPEYSRQRGAWSAVHWNALLAPDALTDAPATPSAMPAVPTDASAAPALLRLACSPSAVHPDPRYYTHFTLSALSHGVPELLNYDEQDTWSSRFAAGATLPAGNYLLVSGTRLADGAVLARLEAFPLAPGATATAPLQLREDSTRVQVIGSFDAEHRYFDPESATSRSLLSTTSRGYYVLALLRAAHEPSLHILHDLSAARAEMEAWGRPILLLFPNVDEWERFRAHRAALPPLPSTVRFGVDASGAVAAALRSAAPTESDALPCVVVADTFNRVVFRSQGYTIGLGTQIQSTVGKLK